MFKILISSLFLFTLSFNLHAEKKESLDLDAINLKKIEADWQIVQSKIMAVCRLEVIPTEQKLVMDSSLNEERSKYLNDWIYPHFFVHSFSIGGIPSNSKNGSINEKALYALLVPLVEIIPQVQSIDCYETLVIGDLFLSDKAILVVPNGTEVNPVFKTFFYDPSKEGISNAVFRVLKELNCWHIDFTKKKKQENFLEMFSFFSENENINSVNFLKFLYNAFPVFEKGRSYSQNKVVNLEKAFFALMTLSHALIPTSSNEVGSYFSTKEIQTLVRKANSHYRIWRNTLDQTASHPEILKMADLFREDLLRWSLIAKIELWLRKKHHKTLKSAPKEIISGMKDYLITEKTLKDYLRSQLSFLTEFSQNVP